MDNNEMLNGEEKENLSFTKEELESLNFSPEELEMIEYANNYVEVAKILGDDADALITKLDTEFPVDLSNKETFEKLNKLCETDPEFIAQLAALQEVLSEIDLEEQSEEK